MKAPQTTARDKGRGAHHILLLAEDSLTEVGIVRIALREENPDHILHVANHVANAGGEAVAYIQDADRNATSPPLDPLVVDRRLPEHDGEEILECPSNTHRRR